MNTTTFTVQMNPLWSILGTIMMVLGIISLWKIFEDRGEKGWKAIIPFYSTKIFGRVAKDEKLGNRTMRAQIFTFILAILVMFIGIAILGFQYAAADQMFLGGVGALAVDGSTAELPPELLEALNSQSLTSAVPSELILGLGVLFLLMIILCIVYLVRQIKLYNRFIVNESAASWLIIVFIFLPAFAYFYFAFIRGKYLDY